MYACKQDCQCTAYANVKFLKRMHVRKRMEHVYAVMHLCENQVDQGFHSHFDVYAVIKAAYVHVRQIMIRWFAFHFARLLRNEAWECLGHLLMVCLQKAWQPIQHKNTSLHVNMRTFLSSSSGGSSENADSISHFFLSSSSFSSAASTLSTGSTTTLLPLSTWESLWKVCLRHIHRSRGINNEPCHMHGMKKSTCAHGNTQEIGEGREPEQHDAP